ncbi:DUF2934 domain-containing protein [Acidithiobacillus ferrianus]|uniref:DUF2934 domain-containing protein n=2 Tax=Acidithiobacillus ferrianus TaxID=2678518 RepID=A0A845UHL6_9PROT|nr:DUF2934 domain-containing protein [Acidithiobacillus ferrianus]NDU41218.1 DUF2934 domain-containing protein [Acidithiobacillus ferrianus]
MTESQPKAQVRKTKETSVEPKKPRIRRPATAATPAISPETHAIGARKSGEGAFGVPARTPRNRKRGAVPTLSAEERQRRIAERAYYIAEARGFVGGDCQADWFAAESWVDAQSA